MIPTFAERVGAYALELKAALTRSHEIPVAKFGISPNASKARNAKALNDAIANVDDGSILTFGSRVYPIDQGVVRGMRGSIELRGAGYGRTVLEYTSITDGTVGVGDCILFGIDQPELIRAGATGLFQDVTLRGIRFRDLNRTPFTNQGPVHWPAALELIFVENALVDACGFENVKGNSALNVLGLGKTQFESTTQRATVQRCWFGGDHIGGSTQGDGCNIGGYSIVTFRGNTTQGGIGRHFFEGGVGIVDLIIEDNIADLALGGLAHVASCTSSRSFSLRRNHFSNWGGQKGASSFTVLPDAPQYDNNGNSIFVGPDGQPLPINKVWGVICEENTFDAPGSCWAAAITIEGGDLRDHTYRNNIFNCSLPFYLVAEPAEPFEISGNTHNPDAPNRSFIALHQVLANPRSPATITSNVIRKNGRLFDSGTWATDARVRGVTTNLISAT